MSPEQPKRNGFDHSLLRLKDLIIIIGSIWAFLAWGTNFASIPKRLEAAEDLIRTVQDRAIVGELKIQSLSQDITYIKDALSEIKKNQEMQMRLAAKR